MTAVLSGPKIVLGTWILTMGPWLSKFCGHGVRAEVMIKVVAFVVVSVTVAFLSSGCEALNPATFPNQVIGADGVALSLEDIEAIVQDSTLSDEQRRAGLRELGLQDEALIEALLSL